MLSEACREVGWGLPVEEDIVGFYRGLLHPEIVGRPIGIRHAVHSRARDLVAVKFCYTLNRCVSWQQQEIELRRGGRSG